MTAGIRTMGGADAMWLHAPVGVVLFLWFVPVWLARDDRGGRGFGVALLVGLALDTALAGLGGGWDYAGVVLQWPGSVPPSAANCSSRL